MTDRYHLRVHALPREVDERELADSAVIVIDVLRATTTICEALASGAREVVPFRETGEALAAAMEAGREQVVLGGERGGMRIDGFDLGNSPAEYTAEAVGGRAVYITTTNGTRALDHARLARRVIVGALVNLSAVLTSVNNEPRIDILCAGTDGRATDEDLVVAGGLVHQLCALGAVPSTEQVSEAAATAGAKWSRLLARARVSGRPVIDELAFCLRAAPGGVNLIELGMDQDIVDCAQVDRLRIVPELDVHRWRITAR